MIDMQEHLLYLTNLIIERDLTSTRLRGVKAKWKEDGHTACLSFYFNGPLVEEDIEEASDLCGGIIAHFSDGLLEESYVRLDYPTPLPESLFWAYKRSEELK
jgi:hypothetical protein